MKKQLPQTDDILADLAKLMGDDKIKEAAVGVSFTSTANVAPYPIPLASFRRSWPKNKKKKKK